MALWYTVADIGLIWQVVYYKQCVTKKAECDQDDEAVALIKIKNLKQRRKSKDISLLSKADNNTVENHQSDESEDDHDGYNELDENNMIDPKMKPLWVNLIGATILILVTLSSCYAYYFMISTPLTDNGDDIGLRIIPQILGWMSAVLYVGSRVPQLIKNWKQQSTEGLSSGMFICAVFGNFFFALVSISLPYNEITSANTVSHSPSF